MKRQLKGWEKIFANHMSDKGIKPELYKELIQLKRKILIISLNNGQRTLINIFLKTTYKWPIGERKVLNISIHQRNAKKKNHNEI